MNHIFLLRAVFPVMFFCNVRADAQDTLGRNLPRKWTLQDCIAYAKKNNIQVNNLRFSASSSQEDLLQSRAARYPNLSAAASQDLSHRNGNNTGSATNVSGNYGFNSSVTLYKGGYLRKDIQQKELILESSGLDIKEAENDVTLGVTQAFLNILLAKENIVFIQDVLLTSQGQLKQGQLKYDAGAISRKDLVQFEAQVASDEYTLVTAQNNLRLNTVTLKQVLQLPSSYAFEIAEPDTVIVASTFLPLPDAQLTAQSQRPEVRNSQLGISIAETELAKARALAKPELSAGGSLSTANSTNQTKYFSQINQNFVQSVGVTLSIPIFTRRVTKTAINRSKIGIEQARLTLLNTRTVLDQLVEQSYINLLNALAQYDAASIVLEKTQETYRIMNEELRLGNINLFELRLQRNQYIQALQDYIQAKYSAVLNYKIYNFYTGVPVTL